MPTEEYEPIYGVSQLVTGEWLVCHPEMNGQHETRESAQAEYDWLCRSVRLGTLPKGTRFECFYGRKPYRITRKDGGVVHVVGDDGGPSCFCACAVGVVLGQANA